MQPHFKLARRAVLILALGVLLVGSPPALAARLVGFTVSMDGKVVLEASWGDDGDKQADFLWRHLKEATLRPFKGYKVEADGDDPLQATLKGKVIIKSIYSGRAEVSELKLVREKDGAPWKIAPAEVERTFKIRQKPVEFRVSVDGKVVLYTPDAYTAAENVDAKWRDLARLEFRPWQGYKVKADDDDPLRATLNGKVILYGGGGRAEVSGLKLVRQKQNTLWKLDPAEVERTFKTLERLK